MTHLNVELPQLKRNVMSMMLLVRSQIHKSKEAIDSFDKDLALEIISNEKRVNARELKIDNDCENILALYQPVAIDLRFVMASYNINSTLERIGDNAESIARYIHEFKESLDADIRKKLRFDEMYENAILMLNSVIDAFEAEDTKLARKVFNLDLILNEIHSKSAETTEKLIKEYPDKISLLLSTYSIIKKLERIGDLSKNIAEEIIFYLEAKVLKHALKKKAK